MCPNDEVTMNFAIIEFSVLFALPFTWTNIDKPFLRMHVPKEPERVVCRRK